jgi:hypothetical protein
MGKIRIGIGPNDLSLESFLQKFRKDLHIYCPNEMKRLDTIEAGQIWSANPLKFNDPFELDVSIDATQMMITDNPSTLINAYIDSMHSKSGSPRFMVTDELIQLLLLHLSPSTGKFINSTDFRADFKTYLSNELKHYGVTCFSKRSDSELMWAYYASGHRGFVVSYEFSEIHYAATRKNESEPSVKQMLHTVEYRSLRPKLDLWKILFTNCIRELFATKSMNWSHEQEVRLVHRFDERLEDGHGVAISLPGGFRVKSITAGAKASAATIKKIRQTAQNLSNSQNGIVDVFRQQLSPITYKMEYLKDEVK